jgi:aryl-alcohol dehydrogenase-like predicted oxidoreductase
VVEACHEALQRLQVDYLDLYFCHRPDKNVPIEEVVWTMHQLIQQGKILYWGTSEWSGVEIMEAHRVAQQHHLIGPAMEQPQYNLFERNKIENEFQMVYKTVGLGTTIWSPLASGLLSGKYNDGIPADSRLAMPGFEWLRDRCLKDNAVEKVKQLTELSNELGTTTPILSIAWCIKNPNVTTAILGATKAAQLTENLKAIEAMSLLTPEVLERIEAIMQNKPILPEY